MLSCGGTDVIRAVNWSIEKADGLARSRNPSSTPLPAVTDVVTVQDTELETVHAIFIHRVDYRQRQRLDSGNVVVFSEPCYAPFRTTSLQLATPAYYRTQEVLKPGIRDRHDGTLTMDGTAWASKFGAARAQFTFASSVEPWVFCAAQYSHHHELQRLRRHFRDEYGYTTATVILDPEAFALWLGIDFALTLNKEVDVSLSAVDTITHALSRYHTSLWDGTGPIDTFTHVYHGPVQYEDRSGDIDAHEKFFDPGSGPRAWFTKKTAFEIQNEYRFAVSTPGKPDQPTRRIIVSEELRATTAILPPSGIRRKHEWRVGRAFNSGTIPARTAGLYGFGSRVFDMQKGDYHAGSPG